MHSLVIIIFVEAAVDPAGREDRTKDSTSENYNENLLSKTSAETLSSEDCDDEELSRPWVEDTRLCKIRVTTDKEGIYQGDQRTFHFEALRRRHLRQDRQYTTGVGERV